MSFRTRVAVLVAGVVAIAVAGVAGTFLYFARAKAIESLDEQLRLRGSTAAQIGEKVTGSQDFIRVQELSRIFGKYTPDDVLLQIFDVRGRIWASNVDPLPIGRRDLAVARRHVGYSIETSEFDGYRMRVLTLPLRATGRAVMIARPMDEVDSQMAALWAVSLQIFFIGVGAAGITGFLVAGRVVRPVRRLQEAATKVAVTQDIDQPISVDRTDEFGKLASSFNEMLSALSRAQEQQRRLVADASHELRTPLTSLRTNLEFIQRNELSPEGERSEAIDDVLFELDELTGLVAEMVDLATDRHQIDEVAQIQLDELVDAVVQRHRRRTAIEIELTADSSQILVSPALAERAVSNMIDNAVKWSPPDSKVRVAVLSGAVIVRDDGPGIPMNERERVFERFYRTEEARSLPGSGLGLSIVRHVADTFGGRARIVDEERVGTTIELVFPEVRQT
tara:strand:- start:27 stop:1376 length:1350 start_codon:yes stop_codon:yes gene_type:complete